MRKVLFIDRDGTLIVEPASDLQVDSLDKLDFLPKTISNLRKIAEEGQYDLVMVTNQDGLGTDSFPEENFWPAHQKMLKTLAGENVTFADIYIDRHFPADESPDRKPGTGMLGKYLSGAYDLANSFVIGDRLTDVLLAVNLGVKAILIASEMPKEGLAHQMQSSLELVTKDWDEIYKFLRLPPRKVHLERNTAETQISVDLNLDGTGVYDISTGLSFFDHMLHQLSRHSGSDIFLKVDGDLHIDEHHTIEDTALTLGKAYMQALGDKRGIARYGFLLPMDDALAKVALDFSGRPWLVWEADFKREKVGDMPTEMFFHFFKSFSDAAGCNLHVEAKGQNEHHKIEAIFKAFAKAIKMAVTRDLATVNELPSTKGVI